MNVRLAEIWDAIRDQLATDDSTTVLNGGRVYLNTEDFAEPPGPEGGAWGRQVIIPSTTLWPVAEVSDLYRPVNFTVRSEMNSIHDPGYNAAYPLEKLQDITYTQLYHWWPGPTTYTRVVVTLWFYRQRPAQSQPQWDADRSLWWMSSEYRFEAARRN